MFINLSFVSFTWNHLQKHFLQLKYHIELHVYKWTWVPGIPSCSLTYCFSFFSVITTFEITPCIFVLKCNASITVIFWYPFFLLGHDIAQYNQNRKAIGNSYHKIIISDNMAIQLSLFTHFDFDPVLSHYVARY